MDDVLTRLERDPLGTLRAALLADVPDAVAPEQDDYTLYPELRPPGQAAAMEAAVLLPLIMDEAPVLLFTRRTAHLSRHSGQVSFPGGRRDPGDTGLAQTAIRETEEETGIAAPFITVAGFLPRYRTGTGFDIHPVVGLLQPGFVLKPDPCEVEEAFTVPLAFFLDPANGRTEEREMGGRLRRFHAFRPGPHYIWGATAAILNSLIGRLTSDISAP